VGELIVWAAGSKRQPILFLPIDYFTTLAVNKYISLKSIK
jgi:hypothetical protein